MKNRSLELLRLAGPSLATAGALTLGLMLPRVARAEGYEVDPRVGNSTLSAVFDAPLGERIMAVSNQVGCALIWDEKAGAMSGTCSVALEAIRVDNDDTKSEHFHQWATHKKADPSTCKLEAKLSAVKPVGPLVAEVPVAFTAEVPFTVCGRGREDGGPEHVTGTAVLLPAGTYGGARTIRIRAHVEAFNREAYRVGPKWTEGWLARVQSLAKVVAPTGTIDLNLFAAAAAKPKQPQRTGIPPARSQTQTREHP